MARRRRWSGTETRVSETEGLGGGFLGNGSAFGVYSGIDLYRAGEIASDGAKTRAASN
jgi:hypothetical protein